MKKITFLLLFLTTFFYGYSQQTISVVGCPSFINDASIEFSFDSYDSGTNTNNYTATASTSFGDINFTLSWSSTNSQWEVSGSTGSSAIVLYFSNTSASYPNPPSLALGTWNASDLISGVCPDGITSLTGYVQDAVEGVETFVSCSAFPTLVSPILFTRSGTQNGKNLFTGNTAVGLMTLAWGDIGTTGSNRWEISETSGVLFSNTSDTTLNPPSLTLGTWVNEASASCSDISAMVGAVENTLSVLNLELASLKFYPNPAKSSFQINTQSALSKVEVYDVMGKSVLRSLGNKKSIKLNGVQSGLYLVSIESVSGASVVKKLIVK